MRSGRIPVIIMTWLGSVSITGSDRAEGNAVPCSRSRYRVGVVAGVISSGRNPSTTSTYTRGRGARSAPSAGRAAALDSTTAAEVPVATRRK